ncbi:hypothetical protein CGZ95_07190 [Enemella evansiae]|uniref:glycerate kinase n=1 Tax=Enemella evansiae TaxID=2016499 RepID=UPI000B978F39|nr:glycerate kinase [Enemella evansiae]OYO01558.1 hypothetical protein CGZ95_07190 [Enemella evansiae]
MRILVATDRIGTLSAAEAGVAIAAGWQRTQPAAELAVAPLGEAGGEFLSAAAATIGREVELSGEADGGVGLLARGDRTRVVGLEPLEPAGSERGIPVDGSSVGIGYAAAQALQPDRPDRLLIDLATLRCHDGGAGLLSALGATADRPLDRGVAAMEGIAHLDLHPVRERLAGIELVAVVPDDELTQPLLGLRGITSLRGRETNTDAAEMLAIDATLERFAALADPEASGLPGAGACGGAAYAVAALGGRILSGPQACAELVGLVEAGAPNGFTETMLLADLVVTGSSRFDFASRGGGVMRYVAEQAELAGTPCIALAGEMVIGSREMRTMGIESAYAVREARATLVDDPSVADIGADELTELAARVAHTWQW